MSPSSSGLVSPDSLLRPLMVLTVTTGVIDAVSYVGLGHVFTANMTGNVVFIGFALAGAEGVSVSGRCSCANGGMRPLLPSLLSSPGPWPSGLQQGGRPRSDRHDTTLNHSGCSVVLSCFWVVL